MKKLLLVLTALLLVTSVSGAYAMSKGSSMLAIELAQGTGIFSDPVADGVTPDYISLNEISDLGVSGEYWYMFSDDYALTLSGGVSFASYKEEPNDPAVDTKDTGTGTSYRVRLGGDRMGQVGDRLTVFAGPGLVFESGKAKFKQEGAGASGEAEGSGTTQFGISGRIGAIMKINDSVGIVGRIGHQLGYVTSSAKTGNAKVTAWGGTFDAAWGLEFAFGGAK